MTKQRGGARTHAWLVHRAAWTVFMLASAFCGSLLAAQAGSAGDPSSVLINETITRYTLAADSIEELRARLQHDIPALQDAGGTHGRTRSDIAIAYEFGRSPAGCRLRNLEVRLEIVVTLPEWIPGKTVPASARARWERTLGALERHEATHRANARAAAEEARARIRQIGLQPDCKSVRDTASRLLRRTRLKYEFRDRRYDARTRNGIAEGVAL
jgi:predicted secreted Zn-dependent protease